MARIAIIGGGIAGLSAAYDLSRDGRHQVALLEQSSRLGGKIVTRRFGGLLVEGGADSVFTAKPQAIELMCELGLEDEFVEPIGGGFSVLVGGQMYPVPRALASLMPTDSGVLESLGFLGTAARKRVHSEHRVPKGLGDDESIASFFRRRFGSQFSKNLAEPLLAGIHAGDADRLSMKALYPNYLNLEQKHGSLTGEKTLPPSTGRSAGFLTLRGGLNRLVDSLTDGLERVDLRLNFDALGMGQTRNGTLQIRGTETVEADAVVVSVPSHTAATLLHDLAPDASALLAQIQHASTAVASFAYPFAAFPKGLHGNGFLVPADEPCDITGCTFSSSKWPGRAPESVVLLRAYLGRDGGMNVAEHSDDALKAMAEASIAKILDARVKPDFSRIDRWACAMPQYRLGHVDLIDRVEHLFGRLPILLAGSSYRGVGIPDCVRQGRDAVRRILERNL